MATLEQGGFASTEEVYLYGSHLALDAFGCDERKLADENLILILLNDLPDRIGMTKIAPP